MSETTKEITFTLKDDPEITKWIADQKDLSASLSQVIKEFIAEHGMSDAAKIYKDLR